MNVGRNIKEERLNRGLTQKEIADRSGLSTSYICDIEVGRTNPSLKTLENLSIVLDVSIEKLLKQY